MNEEWRPIIGAKYYMVSSSGRVRSLDKILDNGRVCRGKILKPSNSKGYHVVSIYYDDKKKLKKVHRLVAESFIENTNNKPSVNHINAIKTDNRIVNLEWCTTLENNIHCHANGLNKGRSLFDEIQILTIYTFINKGNTKKLCEIYNKPRVTIQKIKQGKSYKHFFGRIFNECI